MCTVYSVQHELFSTMECTCVLCTVFDMTCVLRGSFHVFLEGLFMCKAYSVRYGLCMVYSMSHVLGWSVHVYCVHVQHDLCSRR